MNEADALYFRFAHAVLCFVAWFALRDGLRRGADRKNKISPRRRGEKLGPRTGVADSGGDDVVTEKGRSSALPENLKKRK